MSIPEDKLKHGIAGAIIYLGTMLALELCGSEPDHHLQLAAVLLVGIGKEIWDSFGYGECDIWDLVATMTGGLICYALLGRM